MVNAKKSASQGAKKVYRAPLTDAKKAQAIEMWKSGKYYQKDIAEAVDANPTTICELLNKYIAGTLKGFPKPENNGLGKKKQWIKRTPEMIHQIVTMKKSGKYLQKEIGKKLGIDEATISVILKEYRKGKYNAMLASFGDAKPAGLPAAAGTQPGRGVGKVSATSALPEKFQSLDREEIRILQVCNDYDPFVSYYMQKFGITRRKVSELGEMWARRADIIRFDKEKNEVKPPNPIKKEKAAGGDDETSESVEALLARNNRRQTEMKYILDEILKVSKDTLQFFRDEQARVMAEKVKHKETPAAGAAPAAAQ